MNRILLEILSGLAVLVVLVSFNNQISQLQVSDQEVTELKKLVQVTADAASSKAELSDARAAIIEELSEKITELEGRVSKARITSAETAQLRMEISETKRHAEQLKAQLKRDISRTRETVNAYHEEMRSSKISDTAYLKQAQADIAMLATAIRRDPSTLSRELLAPAVQLNGDDTVGSGTLIYSEKNKKSGKFETFVITSYHVIRNILADTPRAKREGIDITIYEPKGKTELKCDMICFEARIDAALLKLRSAEQFTNIARVMSKEGTAKIRVWDSIYAVGCPLGNDPIPTQGEISSLRNELNGANYWMINAPTYFGNSGGAVYAAETRELVGVFSKIYTHGRGNPVVIPHMGLFTPMPLIRKWLEKEGQAFVLKNTAPPPRVTAAQKRFEQLMAPAPGR